MRLHHFDLRQTRQPRLELLPQPHGQIFAGGVFQPCDVIQVAVIERGVDGLPGGLDVSEVKYPSWRRVNVTADSEFDLERMAVQARTGVGFWQRGQAPSALQMKDTEDVHAAFSRKLPALTMQIFGGTDDGADKLSASLFSCLE